MLGKSIRFRRLFRKDSGRAIVIPLDHAVSMGAIQGMDDMAALVRMIGSSGGDGVVLHKGQIERLTLQHGAEVFDNLTIVAHLTGATNMGPQPTRQMAVASVDDALELGADWVSIQINFGCPEEAEMIASLGALTTRARQRGVPVLAMAYVRNGDGTTCLDPGRVCHAARVVEELGASAVKVPLISEVTLRKMRSSVTIPILVAGGQKTDAAHLASELQNALESGASGFCVGRNLFQAEDPTAMLRRLASIVHRQAPRSRPTAMENRDAHNQAV